MSCVDIRISTSVPTSVHGDCCSSCGTAPCCCNVVEQDFVTADGNRFVDDEQPAGLIDSINREFSIENSAVDGTLNLYINGQKIVRGIDFDYFENKITLQFAPDPAQGIFHEDRLRVDYFAKRKCS